MSSKPSDRFLQWWGPAAVFLVAAIFFGILFQALPVLYDTDSYYHLAIARTYARHGIVDDLPWARLSLLRDFADKEFLFHVLLAPFSDTGDPTAGGRWALALLNALVAAVLAFLGFAAVGRWGLAAPLLIYGGSLDFLGRMIRLRPEILSLLLLLAALWCAGRRRYRLLGVVAAVYALSYTAFHVLLGLTAAWFVLELWAHRRRPWGLLLYPLLGTGIGLVIHPHFPQNLVVWKVQSVDFFQQKGALNVGAEIGARSAPDLVWLNLAWAIGLWALWRAADRHGPRREDPMAGLCWVSALIFAALYVLMLRFSVYFIPFTTLAVLYEIRCRGGVLGSWTALPWRGRLPLVLVMAAALALGIPRTATLLGNLAAARGPISREGEWQAFGRSLPPGARVAAEWGSTHIYMFWAPQATFLNVLDPVFMSVRYPVAYRRLRAIFEDREPDVPMTIKTELDSDYLALSRFHQPQSLLRRLDADPRLRLRYQGYTLLYELVPGANDGFVLDWRIVPQGSLLPPPASEIDAFPEYPRAPPAQWRDLEGYVDVTGITGEDCVALVHRTEVAEAGSRLYELAPYGPSKVWIDDDPALAVDHTAKAYIGGGVTFPVHFDTGIHRVTVLTCPGNDGAGRSGFYLMEKGS